MSVDASDVDDLPDMPTTDLSEYKSCAGMAKAIRDHLKEVFPESADHIYAYPPESNKGYGGDYWEVCFEGGPFEWAIKMTGEYDWMGLEGYHDNNNILLEPTYSFALGVHKT